MGTGVPAGTHRNFKILGTAGYRVPMGNEYQPEKFFWVTMGTGYRPEKNFWVPMGTGYRPEKMFWVTLGTGQKNFLDTDGYRVPAR